MQRQWFLGVAVLLICCVAAVQAARRSDDVLGMNGMVSVSVTQAGTDATVVFNSNTPLSAVSSQMVFVLQGDKPIAAPKIVGRARVLTGDGFVAILPENGEQPNLFFKFYDRGVPARLSQFKFQVIDVIGIARYGEEALLAGNQVDCLVANGMNCPAR